MRPNKSSKVLKPIDLHSKQQSILRSRIKLLQQQIQRLQQSNLNIYIPITEHQINNTTDYQSIITKLKTQISTLQQENTTQKNTIKKLEKEKQVLKITFGKQIEELNEEITTLKTEINELKEQISQLNQSIETYIDKYNEIEKQLIEKNVQLKFLKKDLQQSQKSIQFYKTKFTTVSEQISKVRFGSKIYQSLQISVTAIETNQLRNLKQYIEELERKLREIQNKAKMEHISLGVPKRDIGEEIVRLKKNIDMQLGLQCNSKSTQSFLKSYKDTKQLFNKLIDECHK